MSIYTPTPSGRSTPLHFRDVVSALHDHPVQECGYLFECACKLMQVYTTQILTGLSQQVHDVMKQYKNEKDSEAHQVCLVQFQTTVQMFAHHASRL